MCGSALLQEAVGGPASCPCISILMLILINDTLHSSGFNLPGLVSLFDHHTNVPRPVPESSMGVTGRVGLFETSKKLLWPCCSTHFSTPQDKYTAMGLVRSITTVAREPEICPSRHHPGGTANKQYSFCTNSTNSTSDSRGLRYSYPIKR